MDNTKLQSLIGLIKQSRLLDAEERKAWLKRLERMKDTQLARLFELLSKGEKLNWQEEMPKYEAALRKATTFVATVQPSSLSLPLS